MGVATARFVANSLIERLNCRANPSFWLPGRLSAATRSGGAKLLPLTGQDVDVGAIAGDAGVAFRDTIKDQWWITLSRVAGVSEHQPIPDPAAPDPVLSFSGLTISGLENVAVVASPAIEATASGYAVTAALDTNAYAGADAPPTLAIAGRFTLVQRLCSAAKAAGAAPDGWRSVTVEGAGRFTATLTGARLAATLDLALGADGGGPAVTVDRLTLAGGGAAAPAISIGELVFDKGPAFMKRLWQAAAIRALESPQGTAGLIESMGAAIDAPSYRDSLTALMTEQLRHGVDRALGQAPPAPVPASGSAGPIDDYLFARLVGAMGDPASDYFLPRLIAGCASPPLEPLALGTIALPDQSAMDLKLVELRLVEVTMAGLANLQAPAALAAITADGFRAGLLLGGWQPPPAVTRGAAPVTVPAGFTLTARFAAHADDDDTPIEGACTVTAARLDVALRATLGGTRVEDLTVAIDELSFAPSAAAAIAIAPSIESDFLDLITAVLNGAALKQRLVEAIDTALAGRLAALGASVTATARALLVERLGPGVG